MSGFYISGNTTKSLGTTLQNFFGSLSSDSQVSVTFLGFGNSPNLHVSWEGNINFPSVRVSIVFACFLVLFTKESAKQSY